MSTSKNVASVLRHTSVLYCCVRAAENSHRQGSEVCSSRQACDFESSDRPNDVAISTIHPRPRQMSNAEIWVCPDPRFLPVANEGRSTTEQKSADTLERTHRRCGARGRCFRPLDLNVGIADRHIFAASFKSDMIMEICPIVNDWFDAGV
jgi:hypothetical protein